MPAFSVCHTKVIIIIKETAGITAVIGSIVPMSTTCGIALENTKKTTKAPRTVKVAEQFGVMLFVGNKATQQQLSHHCTVVCDH